MKNAVILCVDDEKMVLNSLKEQIKRYFEDQEEFEVQVAESGEEALEIIEEIEEDGDFLALVISDQIMPTMKGDQLLIEIQKRRPETLKILLTGQADLEAIRNAINNAGLYRYIAKPWDPHDLMLTIEQACKSFQQKVQLNIFDEQIRLLNSLNKSSQDISVELDLKTLYAKIVKNAMANMNADKIILVIENADDKYNPFNIVVECKETAERRQLEETISSQGANFGHELIRYMIQTLNLPKIDHRMVIPIKNTKYTGRNHGYLLLENSLKSNVFDTKQYEMMVMLASQASSSIENARLISKLDQTLQDVEDSIHYAKRIQFSLLPSIKKVQHHLPDSFIYYRPKDIVSGDFYWFYPTDRYLYLAAVDCTGHGVPGAFMSILGSSEMNQIVGLHPNVDTNELLHLLHHRVATHLSQQVEGQSINDGMDLCLCRFDPVDRQVQFSGANRPLIVVRNGEVFEYQTDKKAIGHASMDAGERYFDKLNLPYQRGDMFYLFSDGMTDQFGGERGKKLGKGRLKEVMLEMSDLSAKEQYARMDNFMKDWMGSDHKQLDDQILIGVRVD